MRKNVSTRVHDCIYLQGLLQSELELQESVNNIKTTNV